MSNSDLRHDMIPFLPTRVAARLLTGVLCVALASGGAVMLAGCSDGGTKDEAVQEQKADEAAEKKDDTTPEKEDDAAADEKAKEDAGKAVDDIQNGAKTLGETDDGKDEDSSDEQFDTWAEECMDSYNDPTVYAISELRGWQLETLLQQRGYTWHKDDLCWFDGHTTVRVFDADLYPLDDEAIGQLDRGSSDQVVLYVINTPNYPTCSSAYEELVSNVMVSKDVVFDENFTASFGVAYGPSMRELLVEMVTDDAGLSVFVFPKAAIEAGLFDVASEGEYGSTPSEVFESMSGHWPGE